MSNRRLLIVMALFLTSCNSNAFENETPFRSVKEIVQHVEKLEKNTPEEKRLAYYESVLAKSEKGDLHSTLLLFGMYYPGNFVKRDRRKALELAHQAIDRGFFPMYIVPGVCFEFGMCGSEKNSLKAYQMYIKGAKRGYADSAQKLCYSSTLPEFYTELPKQIKKNNYQEALKWCKTGREKDKSTAGENLNVEASIYITQEFSGFDEKKSCDLYRKSADLGEEYSLEPTINCIKRGFFGDDKSLLIDQYLKKFGYR